MFGSRHRQSAFREPPALALVIGQVDLEGQMVYGGGRRIQANKSPIGRTIKQGQHLRVAAGSLAQPKEGGSLKPPQQLQSDDVLIKGLHRIEIAHSQGDLSQSSNPPLHRVTP